MVHAEIKPDCFYDLPAVRRLLGLSTKAINKACRDGLRSNGRLGERLFKGAWLIEWLEAGAVSGMADDSKRAIEEAVAQ